jgi:exopolyphosphatase/pppGpp-phosphohydrolase
MTPTQIDIGPQQAVVHCADSSLVLALGSAAIAERHFRHDPPTPAELEGAIDAVEGEVMRAHTPSAGDVVLTAVGAALSEVADAAARADAQDMLTLEAVEQLFQRVASASLGNPVARRGLPGGNRFVATLLILREFMHHRGFASVRFAALD